MSAIDIAKRMRQMRLTPMAAQLERRLLEQPMPQEVEQWLTPLLDAKENARQMARQERETRRAGLFYSADLSGIDYRRAKGFDANDIKRLSSCDWVRDRRRMLISGGERVGKTWLACAWGTQAIGMGYRVRYWDTMDLLDSWHEAALEGRLREWREELAACDLLILDNFLTYRLKRRRAEILLRIIIDREQHGAVITASLYQIAEFHRQVSNPMIAAQLAGRFSAAHLMVMKESWKETASRNVSAGSSKAASRSAGRVPNI